MGTWRRDGAGVYRATLDGDTYTLRLQNVMRRGRKLKTVTTWMAYRNGAAIRTGRGLEVIRRGYLADAKTAVEQYAVARAARAARRGDH